MQKLSIILVFLLSLFVSACHDGGRKQRDFSCDSITLDSAALNNYGEHDEDDVVLDTDTCNDSNVDKRLRILFTGDVLLDRGVRLWIQRKGVRWLFEGVEDEFKKSDAVIINLECPITDSISSINKKFIFRADVQWTKELHDVGITHAALSNNHTNDQGRRGLKATNHHLLSAGIQPIGYGMNENEQAKPVIISKNGINVAVFNSVTFTLENWVHLQNRPGICQLNPKSLSKIIKNYKTHHKNTFVAVVLHWGLEFQSLPTRMQRNDAHLLTEAGADVIVGHHPHVLQPVDTINHTPVFYSIGNFVFDQSPSVTRKSMIASVEFSKNGVVESNSIPVKIEKCRPIIERH